MLFEGTLSICNLQNTAEAGEMPCEKLVVVDTVYYGERTVGYGRQYAAIGVAQQVDKLVRIWRKDVSVKQYVVLDDGQQYVINMVQNAEDEDGIKITDLTLRRLDDNFDVEEADDNGDDATET